MLVWRTSPQGRRWDTWYYTDHWAVSSFLYPWKDIFPCVTAQLSTHSTGFTHLCWKDRWDTVKLRGRSQKEECERRIIPLILLLPFLVCLFLTCRNEQRHMNPLLGVDFGQPWGQEAPTSCFTDCMMACLQFAPEYVGEFQLLTCFQVPYFWSFHDLCLQSALQVPWTPTEYCQGAPYFHKDFMPRPLKERLVKGGLWYELLEGSSVPHNFWGSAWKGYMLSASLFQLSSLLNTCC